MAKKKKPTKIVDGLRSDSFDYMKTVKNNLDQVIMNKDIKLIMEDLVHRTNKLVIHAYQFIKLYCIHCIRSNINLPYINKDYITDVFKVISVRSDNRGNSTKANKKGRMGELTDFYKNRYSKTICSNEEISYDRLSYVLPYEAIDMTININNNIQMNFINRLYKYINIRLNLKVKLTEITLNNPGIENKDKRETLHKQLREEVNKVKYDIISLNEDLTSDEIYHEFILDMRKNLFPGVNKFRQDNIHYDIKVNPQKYLYGMFYIAQHIEILNLQSPPEAIKHRLFNVLPLRTNIIAKNICIDTPALIMNFVNKDKGWYLKYYKELDLYNELWRKFFKLDNQSFKKNKYKFSNMIRTDGVSCCVLFVKTDDNGKPRPKEFSDFSLDINPEYIETAELTSKTKAKRVVCVDPGHSDLIYCGSWNKPMKIVNAEKNDKIKFNKHLDTFRYTQNQRRSETKSKKYNKILDTRSKETIIEGENKSVKEIETDLSDYNKKSSFYWTFFDYLLQKNKTNFKLQSYYADKLFRKLKLNRYINTQKSESKMINNFKAKFGGPDKAIFVLGDYDKGSYHMRGLEPAICKKFRRIFRYAGYETFLINEYKTSKVANCCKDTLEKFRYTISKKPKNKGQEVLCHGLLRCQSVKQKCETIHNRDKNAVINMLSIVQSIYDTGTRPPIFTRTESSQISLTLFGV
jgi:hypothetical protein